MRISGSTENAMADNAKPHKPVPCPRCQSLNTKFCYFNNYNVKQPRHFCRECQRYWTAGGSLRNVPVGAGRRKNKSSYNCNGTKSSDTGHATKYASTSCNVSRGDLANQDLQDPSHTDVSGRKFSGFAEMGKNLNQDVSLELKLSKERPEERIEHEVGPSTVNEELRGPSPAAAKHDMLASHHLVERDESTCCSSVTATLACSSSEAISQPATSTVMMPVLPCMNNSNGFSNPASWGPLMWPWLWPFILSGTGTMLTPGGMPQVDPTSLAVAFSSVTSVPQVDPALALRIGNLGGSNIIPQAADAVSKPQPQSNATSGSTPLIDPALMAQLGALASGTMPQHIDPTLSAAVTASFLQWQRAWNPYAWALPWNLHWNAGVNTSPNLTNMLNKRPQSPTQAEEQKSVHAPKILRTEPLEAGTMNTTSATTTTTTTVFQPLVNGFQPKADMQKAEEESQVKLPHQLPSKNVVEG